MDSTTPLDRAIKQAGSQKLLADMLGIKPPSIAEWRERGRVPANRVIAIENITGISRHELRPDLYPDEQASA